MAKCKSDNTLKRAFMTTVCRYAFPPVFVPQVRNKLLVAFTQRRLLVCSDQSAAVDEELSERRTEPWKTGERRTMRSDVMQGHPEPAVFFFLLTTSCLFIKTKQKSCCACDIHDIV